MLVTLSGACLFLNPNSINALCYVYVCSQFNLSSKSLQTCSFALGFSLLSGLIRITTTNKLVSFHHAWTRPLSGIQTQPW